MCRNLSTSGNTAEKTQTERGEFITPPRPTGRRSNKLFLRLILKVRN